MMMINERLEELKAVCKRATVGPWKFVHMGLSTHEIMRMDVPDGYEYPDVPDEIQSSIGLVIVSGMFSDSDEASANAEFIAASREAVPELIDLIESQSRVISFLAWVIKNVDCKKSGFRVKGEE